MTSASRHLRPILQPTQVCKPAATALPKVGGTCSSSSRQLDKLLLPLQAVGGEGGQGPAHGCGCRAARRVEDGDGLQRATQGARRQSSSGQRLSAQIGFIQLLAPSQRLLLPWRGRGGVRAADQLESGTERGRRRRRGLQLDGVGLAARDAPLPSCNLHTAGVLTGLIPSSWRTPAWGGRSGRELTRRREAHTQFSRGKKKKPPSAASKSRKPTQRCQEDWC